MHLRHLLPLSLVLPLLVVLAPAPVQADHERPFEVDGNTSVDTAGGIDWDVVGTHVPDRLGEADESTFPEGTEGFVHPDEWGTTRGDATPGPDDVSQVLSH